MAVCRGGKLLRLLGSRLVLIALCCCAGRAGAQEATVVHVDKIGAVANDGKDDGPAVRKAINGLRNRDGCRLVFGKGRYDFLPFEQRGRKRPAMTFWKCNDLIIEGRKDTVLMFNGLTAAMTFGFCKKVTVRNLTIDWDRPPFSVGKVKAVRKRGFDIEIEKQFPVRGGEHIEAFMEYDPGPSPSQRPGSSPTARLPLRGGIDAYRCVKSTELIAPQVLRVNLTRHVPVKLGVLLVLRHQVYRYNALSFRECSDVKVEDVRIYTAPGMGVTGQRTRNITLQRVEIRPRPGSNRIMSTTADATHFNGCSGTIRIENCYFEGMGDDATNVHGMWHKVKEVADKHTVVTTCRNGWLVPPRPGHRMEFTDPKTILPYGEGIVKSVKLDRKAKVHRITFDGPLPERVKPGDVLGNVDWAPKLIIRGCTVRGNRARGFLIQTRNALIENNRFERCTGAAIHVTTDVGHWTESMGTRNVTIRNNTFDECNYAAAKMSGVINVFAHLPGWKYVAAAGVHRGLVIEGNTIRNTDNAAIFINAADGVIIRNNVIENCSRARTRTSGKSAIYLLHSRNVTITGNTLAAKPRGKDLSIPVGIGPGCDKRTITVKDNTGF